MTYRLLLFCEEEEHFVMEIMSPPSATFRELHDLILCSCSYTELGNHLFLVCDENWKTREKIQLRDTGNTAMDEDLYLMDSTALEDFLDEEGQHLAYLYEPSSRKAFIIELVETIFGTTTAEPHISRSKGTPPVQAGDTLEDTTTEPALSDNAARNATANSVSALSAANTASDDEDDDADNATDDDFSEDELDMEGFEVSDM